MNRSIQTLCYLISAIALFGGLADVANQFFNDQEIHWRIPLILIGTGVGLPLIIFPFHIPAPEQDEDDYDDNDLSGVYEDSPGFLSSSSNNGPSSDYDHYDSTDTGGSD